MLLRLPRGRTRRHAAARAGWPRRGRAPRAALRLRRRGPGGVPLPGHLDRRAGARGQDRARRRRAPHRARPRDQRARQRRGPSRAHRPGAQRGVRDRRRAARGRGRRRAAGAGHRPRRAGPRRPRVRRQHPRLGRRRRRGQRRRLRARRERRARQRPPSRRRHRARQGAGGARVRLSHEPLQAAPGPHRALGRRSASPAASARPFSKRSPATPSCAAASTRSSTPRAAATSRTRRASCRRPA